jgi:hypothetical protein
MTFKKLSLLAVPAVALVFGPTSSVQAGPVNLVTNGGFETLTSGAGQLGYNTNATGWTSGTAADAGYNFIFAPNTADTTGSTGEDGNLTLWGPKSSATPLGASANGLPGTSPDGGNYLAADGAYKVAAITQQINGLTVGQQYQVSFEWAGAQQEGVNFTSATTENWSVSLGSETYTTAPVTPDGRGFSGWQNQTFTYTATSVSETLSFLAAGTPSGEPPFSLLDGVSLNAVPEPSAVLLMGLGLFGLGAAGVRQRLHKSRGAARPATV